MSDPRKHHYLPQFYLRGFCQDGASLYQVEKESGKYYGVNVKDVAAIRDYHEIDSQDVADPMAVEKELAKIEGELSIHLDLLLREGVTNRQALSETIGLLSLLRMRVPSVKRHLEASLESNIRRLAEAMELSGRLPPVPEGLEDKLRIRRPPTFE